jgi:branched-chain amino acid transport system substrate-binding protein
MTRTVPGYRLAVQPEDGQSLLQVAAQAPTKLAADPVVAAVLGTYNSSTAQSAAPIHLGRPVTPSMQNHAANTGHNRSRSPPTPAKDAG